AEVHEQRFRPAGQSDTKPQCLFQELAGTHFYQPTNEMKGWVDLAQSGVRRGSTSRYHSTTGHTKRYHDNIW
ncbi:hypothetical protein TNCV_3436811, partial [Trichonephila clavipes]